MRHSPLPLQGAFEPTRKGYAQGRSDVIGLSTFVTSGQQNNQLGGKRVASKILGLESRTLCNARKHARADLLSVMKREHDIGPIGARKSLVGTGLAFKHPADSVEGCEDARGLGRRPRTHAAAMAIEMG